MTDKIRLGPRRNNEPLDLALEKIQEPLTRHCNSVNSYDHGDGPHSIAAVKRIAISSRKEAYSRSPDA